jgi:hypothetical protein
MKILEIYNKEYGNKKCLQKMLKEIPKKKIKKKREIKPFVIKFPYHVFKVNFIYLTSVVEIKKAFCFI